MRNTWYMVKIGFATFLTELAMSVMMLTGNYMFMSMLHEDGVAAFAVACYLFPLVFSISNAVAQSAQPIISFNYGARYIGQSQEDSASLGDDSHCLRRVDHLRTVDGRGNCDLPLSVA